MEQDPLSILNGRAKSCNCAFVVDTRLQGLAMVGDVHALVGTAMREMSTVCTLRLRKTFAPGRPRGLR